MGLEKESQIERIAIFIGCRIPGKTLFDVGFNRRIGVCFGGRLVQVELKAYAKMWHNWGEGS